MGSYRHSRSASRQNEHVVGYLNADRAATGRHQSLSSTPCTLKSRQIDGSRQRADLRRIILSYNRPLTQGPPIDRTMFNAFKLPTQQHIPMHAIKRCAPFAFLTASMTNNGQIRRIRGPKSNAPNFVFTYPHRFGEIRQPLVCQHSEFWKHFSAWCFYVQAFAPVTKLANANLLRQSKCGIQITTCKFHGVCNSRHSGHLHPFGRAPRWTTLITNDHASSLLTHCSLPHVSRTRADRV